MADVLITGCGTTDCNNTYPWLSDASSGGGGGNYGPNPHGYYLFYNYGEWLITNATDGNGNNYGPPYYYGGPSSTTDPTASGSWSSYYGSDPGPTIAFAVSFAPNTPTSFNAYSGIGVSLSYAPAATDDTHGSTTSYNIYRASADILALGVKVGGGVGYDFGHSGDIDAPLLYDGLNTTSYGFDGNSGDLGIVKIHLPSGTPITSWGLNFNVYSVSTTATLYGSDDNSTFTEVDSLSGSDFTSDGWGNLHFDKSISPTTYEYWAIAVNVLNPPESGTITNVVVLKEVRMVSGGVSVIPDIVGIKYSTTTSFDYGHTGDTDAPYLIDGDITTKYGLASSGYLKVHLSGPKPVRGWSITFEDGLTWGVNASIYGSNDNTSWYHLQDAHQTGTSGVVSGYMTAPAYEYYTFFIDGDSVYACEIDLTLGGSSIFSSILTGDYTQLNGSPVTSKTYVDTTGSTDVSYGYAISAVNTVGESAMTEPIFASNNETKGVIKSSGCGTLLSDLLSYYTSKSANLETIFDHLTVANDMVIEGNGGINFSTDDSSDKTLTFDGTCYAGCESPTLTDYATGGGYSIYWRGTPTANSSGHYSELFQGLGIYIRWNNNYSGGSTQMYLYGEYNSSQWNMAGPNNNSYIGTDHNFCLTYDGTSGYAKFYVDGSLAAISNNPGTVTTASQAYLRLNSGDTDHTVAAKWKELGIWERAITSQEVHALGTHRWSLAVGEPDPEFTGCPIPIGGLKLFVESQELALSDGTSVALLPDQSPDSNDLVQYSGTYMPKFYNNQYKSFPSIRFTSGQSYFFALSSAINLPGKFTQILIFKNPTSNFLFGNYSNSDFLPTVAAADYSMLVVKRDASGVYTVLLNTVDITSEASITTDTSELDVNQCAKSG